MSDAGLSREEFEKWVRENDPVMSAKLERATRGYAWVGTQLAWEMWQAASSQASTQPKCNCGAGDDAYLACHADVCALKKWAAPRYEISQETKEEWARRIAEESAKDQDSFGGVFMSVERVLAILNQEK